MPGLAVFFLGSLSLGACNRPAVGSIPGPSTDQVQAFQASSASDLPFVETRVDGAPGDFVLCNDQVCAVFDAVGLDSDGRELRHHRAPSGATLLDFGPVGGDDELTQVSQILGSDPGVRVIYDSMGIVEQGRALQATGGVLDLEGQLLGDRDAQGRVQGLVVTTTWRMFDKQPWMEVETTLENTGRSHLEAGPVSDLFLTDGGSLDPFVPSPGWGWSMLRGQRCIVPWVAFSGHFSLGVAYAVAGLGSEWVEAEPAMDQAGRVRAMVVGSSVADRASLDEGESRTWVRVIAARSGNSVGHAVDTIVRTFSRHLDSGLVSLGLSSVVEVNGSVDPRIDTDLVFHRLSPDRFVDALGQVSVGGVMPVSALAATNGHVRLTLPVGDYEVEATAPGYRTLRYPITVDPADSHQDPFVLTGQAPAPVHFAVLDDEGVPLAGFTRLTFIGIGGTPDPWPDFASARRSTPGSLAQGASGNRVAVDGSGADLSLPVGSYRVIASRGIRYGIASAEFNVPTSTEVVLSLTEPLIELPGWFMVDPVVSSLASAIGGNDDLELLSAAAAEDLRFVVRADDRVAAEWGQDSPDVAGPAGILGSLDTPRPGAVEGDGWFAAWPFQGELQGQGLAPGDWLDGARRGGATCAAILAPRAERDASVGGGVFATRGFERDIGIDDPNNDFLRETSAGGSTLLDFDAIEVLSPRDPWNTSTVVGDWFAFLDAGVHWLPYASSSTGWLGHDWPGIARIVAYSESDDPVEAISAVTDGHFFVTTGPIVAIYADGGDDRGQAGDTVLVPDGTADVTIIVLAPSWVPVSQVRLWVNGRLQEQWEVTATEGRRLDTVVTLRGITESTWLTADAGDPESQPSGAFSEIYPNMPAYGISAPIWLEP